MFVTAISGVINIETGAITLCDAGHNTPIMSLENSGFSYKEIEKSMPLGIMPQRVYKDTKLELKKKDTLLFYTDGFTECVGKSDKMLGEQALIDVLKDKLQIELKAISNNLWNLIERFRQGTPPSDDTTLLILRFLGK